jgi:hypothetical protein
MGWADCGFNRHGQRIGYAIVALCDAPCCTTAIDRGLANLCGDMHDDERTCAKYFCGDHRWSDNRCPRCKHIPREGEEDTEEVVDASHPARYTDGPEETHV